MDGHPNKIIEFDNVTFAYPGDKSLLQNLSLALRPLDDDLALFTRGQFLLTAIDINNSNLIESKKCSCT
jgi:ABC-type multidrug transport system fused ATPase/permease subunit